jgi:hypothetical protein
MSPWILKCYHARLLTAKFISADLLP